MKLQQKIIENHGRIRLNEMEIPTYIKENLKNDLREYQNECLKLYLLNDLEKRYLMFNMATGSGKTLIAVNKLNEG